MLDTNVVHFSLPNFIIGTNNYFIGLDYLVDIFCYQGSEILSEITDWQRREKSDNGFRNSGTKY
jgi:hypothetical protein